VTDLDNLNADWLIASVRQMGNSAPLITHLRSGGQVTPELAELLGEILAGEVKVKPRTPKAVARLQTPTMRATLKLEIVRYAEILADMPREHLDVIDKLLKEAGHQGELDTRTKCNRAAKLIVRHRYGHALQNRPLTAAQLDEILTPRAARPRNTF